MKYKIFFLCLAFSGIFLGSCKNFVEGINEDPNNAEDAPVEVVLTSIYASTIIAHEGHPARLAGMWSRQFTGDDRQYAAYEVYTINSSEFQWDVNYIIAKNADVAIQKAKEGNNLLASGIAKILKAHTLGMTASLWGDVPFSEAAQFPEVLDAKFDGQESVYNNIEALLDDAISDLSGSPTSGPVEDKDIFFGGDASAWLTVAQTLKARFYLHTGDYINAAGAASKGLLDAAGDWIIPHPTGTYLQDMNIYYSFGVFDREGYMNAKKAILPAWLDPASATYRGNAKTDETERFNFIFTGSTGAYDLNYDGKWAADASFPLVTALENHLILAECAWRANDMPTALAELNNARGILAAQFPDGKYEAYEMADFEANGIAGRPGSSANDALLYEIMEEKYCSLVGQIEVFNDLRRTDNLLGIPPTTGNTIPQRFLIPQVEIDANANAPSPIPDLFEPTPVNK
ncbi:MAG: SusD/RagB family nutrient-binding outer membrane lipoprotein [Lewinellaceae bacterium]|nr:SusD/RagB family nutrient-binding outer membrane lipoprotein [Saprospiraceae bacterium]MCB9338899.1 SusD/RagB family nutrient-binding outer membrane lipoprotein [Lewinellaceae bacterium]